MSCFYVEPFLFSADQRRNEKERTLKLKHLMPSVKQLENSVLGNSCPVSSAVEEESSICYSTRCALQRKRFKSSALAFFTTGFCCTTAIGQSPAFSQVSKGKKCPSHGKIYWDLSESCEGVRPWVGPSVIRIFINPHYRTSNYPCDNLEECFFSSPVTLQPCCVMCNFSWFCVLKNIILQRSLQTHSG